MNKFKKSLATAGVVVALGLGSVAVTPLSASANTADRVCLVSKSAPGAYLTVWYMTGPEKYVNRGGCSSSDFFTYLRQWRVANGFVCQDTLTGERFVDNHIYGPRRVTMECRKEGGAWGSWRTVG